MKTEKVYTQTHMRPHCQAVGPRLALCARICFHARLCGSMMPFTFPGKIPICSLDAVQRVSVTALAFEANQTSSGERGCV